MIASIPIRTADEREAYASNDPKRIRSDRMQFVNNLGILLAQTSAEVVEAGINDLDVLTIRFVNGHEATAAVHGQDYIGIVRTACMVLRLEGY